MAEVVQIQYYGIARTLRFTGQLPFTNEGRHRQNVFDTGQ